MKMDKKAQFKIQEMAFVLVAIAVLFGFVLIFFARFQLGIVQQSASEVRREQAVNTLHTISAMPELRCSEAGGEVNCIDKTKVEAFVRVRTRYNELWKNAFISRVKIEQFYPKGPEYVLYSGPSTSTTSYSTYIPLCEQQGYDLNCTIGKITVSSQVVE
jgi:hypothetical protein